MFLSPHSFGYFGCYLLVQVLTDSEAVSLLEQMLPGRDVPPMTAPGEDDYLRMIKGHSKEQVRKNIS